MSLQMSVFCFFLLWLASIPLCACVCISYLLYPLIHPSVDGHLYRSPVLDTVNSAAINMCVFELAFSLDICPGVGLQDHMVVLFLFF